MAEPPQILQAGRSKKTGAVLSQQQYRVGQAYILRCSRHTAVQMNQAFHTMVVYVADVFCMSGEPR